MSRRLGVEKGGAGLEDEEALQGSRRVMGSDLT